MPDDTAYDCCFVCGNPYDAQERRLSRDHILPRHWGGQDLLYGDVRNLRDMCRHCNTWRGIFGHCLGALACARAASKRLGGGSLRSVARLWRVSNVVAGMASPRVDTYGSRPAMPYPASPLPTTTKPNPVPLPALSIPVTAPPAARQPPVFWPALEPTVFRSRPYTLKNLRQKPKPIERRPPKELVMIGGIVAMRWDVRGTGKQL